MPPAAQPNCGTDAPRGSLGTEAAALARVAGPIVVAEIGWMAMGLVDTLMVGKVGPSAIAATGTGGSIYFAFAIFGMGLMLGLDTLVSQAYGAGRMDECRRWLRQGLWLALACSPVVLAMVGIAWWTMPRWGLHPTILADARPYLAVVAIGTPFLLVYGALRRYLLGIHLVRPIVVVLLTANVVNAVGNWIFIYGHLGVPALGVSGSALATTLSRIYLAAALWWVVRRTLVDEAGDAAGGAAHAGTLPPDDGRPRLDALRRLVALGIPAAGQITLEVGVFSVATGLAARLNPDASASHQIALNVASVIFMVPLGLSSAAAVRVGHAIGAGDAPRAVRAGWLSLATGAAFMGLVGIVMALWPAPMIRAFTSDPRVLDIGAGLLVIAAAFQLFDSTQAIATGALRGVGDTMTPMVVNLIGHWLLGLPVGYLLCFRYGWGVAGLWVGLSVGLVFAGLVLVSTWAIRTRRLVHAATGA